MLIYFDVCRLNRPFDDTNQDRIRLEADEIYVGGKGKGKRGRGAENKTPVFTLVQRDGKVKSTVVPKVSASNLKEKIRQNIQKSAIIMIDEFRSYHGLDKEFVEHHVVNHGRGEYVRGNAHTNTIEGFFSLLKRGITGTFHHISKEHLNRYLAEFYFRWNNKDVTDGERTDYAIKGFEGKRLMYRHS